MPARFLPAALLVVIAGGAAGSFLLDGGLAILSVVIFAIALWYIATRKVRFPLRSQLIAAVVLLGGLSIYLAVDLAPAPDLPTIEQLAPSSPESEASYAVLMRYGAQHPLGKTFKAPPRLVYLNPDKPETWKQALTERRADIENQWNQLAAIRSWVGELNAFDRVGDQFVLNGESVPYPPIRAYFSSSVDLAAQQALDGHGDEAIETLLPMLDLANKLEAGGRSVTRITIARSGQQSAIVTARYILENSTVSPAAKSRFTAALAKAQAAGGETGAKRIFEIEAASAIGLLESHSSGEIAGMTLGAPRALWEPLRVVGPLLFNRRRTIHTYADYMKDVAQAAAARDYQRLDSIGQELATVRAKLTAKNVVGTLILRGVARPFSTITRGYWAIEDARSALQRLLAR